MSKSKSKKSMIFTPKVRRAKIVMRKLLYQVPHYIWKDGKVDFFRTETKRKLFNPIQGL